MNRVYSIRLPARTIHGCYQLLDQTGYRDKNIATGTVISNAINSMIESLIGAGQLNAISEADAEKAISKLVTVRNIEAFTIDIPKGIPMGNPITTSGDSSGVIERMSAVQRVIDNTVESIQESEDNELLQEIRADSILRVSPDDAPKVEEKVIPLLSVAEVEDDEIYKVSDNELFKWAVRATYYNLPKSKWGTPDAAKLCISTYNIFKRKAKEKS